MRARRRFEGRLWLMGAVSLTALALTTGCGGDGGSGGEVASAATPKGSATASPGASSELSEYVDAQRRWVSCLRDAGLDAPDPDARGRVDLGDQTKWKRDPKALQAQEKCAGLSVAVPDSVEKAQQPELSKDEIRTKQRYATCMQEHGAPDFPDTDASGHFQDVTWDPASAGAKRAARTCASIIGVPDDAPAPQG
ncbi:hypothetical protein [Streptomyces sp. OR43]|uniref:hypothetical protein n=1 Tax=Streptomyces sp. or43 TaxID=2478957 RepID=UPI0011CDB72E|nr:hypothetical protein [Streptomyces sp. or43]TXS39397.1 hypothetical protein EAO72_25510 [Streptomyces sp. or43]